MTARRPITGQLIEDLRQQVLPADLDLLTTMFRVRMATGIQLQRIHHGTDEAAKQRRIRQMTRLSRLHLVAGLPSRIGGPHGGSRSSVYVLDAAGLRLINPTGSARRPWTTSTPFVAHALAVTELYVSLTELDQAGAIELIRFDAEPRCWRGFTDRRGEHVVLKPDADVTIAAGEFEHHAFVEVDLATESRPRIAAKAQRYVDYIATGQEQQVRGILPSVVWVTPTELRRDVLDQALRPASRRLPGVFRAATNADANSILRGGSS